MSHRQTITQIKTIASRNIANILDSLNICYIDTGLVIKAVCPCQQHGGDRSSQSFNWRKDFCHWICWSHHCEEKFGSDIIGLIRSVTNMSFIETKKYLEKFIDSDVNIEVINTKINNRSLHIHKPLPENHLKWLSKQPKYLLDRGFSSSILDTYQIGLWQRLGTFMHDRAVIPIRDHEGFLVGYSGRTIHDEAWFTTKGLEYQKWLHGRSYFNYPQNSELLTGSILFNLDKAKNYIRPLNKVILVEGPLDGLKLSMSGIYNWVCSLGTGFGPIHRSLLVKYGVTDLFEAFDPDAAGRQGAARLSKIIGNLINIHHVELPSQQDPGQMSVNDIKERFMHCLN